MQRNLLPTELEQLHPDRRLPRRRIGAASPSAGFFTIGIAIAVLATGALVAGAGQALDVVDSASAPAPSRSAAERTQPVDDLKEDGAGSVVVSEAPASVRTAAGGNTKPRP